MPGRLLTLTALFTASVLFGSFPLEGQQPLKGFSLACPFKSESQTRRFLNTIVLDALLTYDYTESDASTGTWKTESISTLMGKRYLIKYPGYGGSLTREIAYASRSGRDFADAARAAAAALRDNINQTLDEVGRGW